MEDIVKELTGDVARTVIPVVALGTTIFLFRLNRKRKLFGYRILSQETLFDVSPDIAGRVEVLVDGKPAAKLGLVVVEIANTGNETIKPEEFVKPLVFSFNPEAVVVSAQVVRMKPENIGAEITHDTSSVTVTPILMNAGDQFALKILVREFDGKVRGDARIVGVKELGQKKERAALPRWSNFLIDAQALVAVMILAVIFLIPEDTRSPFLIIGLEFVWGCLMSFGIGVQVAGRAKR